jgi:uncharacterized protein YndB with AHSA1/START domain
MKRTIRKTVTYPHPREHVWRAITDPALLGQWLMPNDFAPVPGHKFQFRTDPKPGWDGIVNCEVLEVAPPGLLKFAWVGGPLNTVVTFKLEALAENQTRLDFEHSGFDGVRAVLVSFILGPGWGKMFKKRMPRVMLSASFIADCEEDGLAAKIIGHVAAALPAKRN